VQRHRDDTQWQDLAGYVRAVRSGSRIEVSGTTASAADGAAMFAGDVYGQTLDALRRSVDAVTALGGSVSDVVRTRVLLVPGCEWRDAARAHREVFADHPPANTTLFVAGLIGDGLLVEVEVFAEVGG
jgi:enamine deaminase RidA (YjgF/YER057c/UK114 family)